MRFARGFGGFALALVVGVSVVLSGCGGGSGGGGSGGGGQSVINLITVQGVGTPLWQNVAGTPTPPPVCPGGVFINSTFAFTFGGAVNPLSIPQTGIAQGSINIFIAATGAPAVGTFTVIDDPTGPAGNQRRVLFTPTPPGNPNAQCASGLGQNQTYQITIPKGGSSPQVVEVAGSPITNDASTCFVTCGCPNPMACVSPFTDPVPGAPFVISTTPTSSNPSPPAIDPANVVGNTIQILISEALNPAGINLANIQVVNSATGAQVPGTLNFFQAGSIPGLGINSRIDYVASGPLLGSVIYQILLSPSVTDFGGNPLLPAIGDPTAQRFFQTIQVNFCPQPPLFEGFDNTLARDLVTGAMRWSGDGILTAEFPIALTGTGTDMAFMPPVSATPLILDTNQLVMGVSRQGIWNFTDVNIPNGATVRIIGPYQAHFRCTGACTVNGTINVNAGILNPALPTTPAYDRGAESGVQNNGGNTNCEALPGVANAGGGQGGTGSGVFPQPGQTPTFQCGIRAEKGENGYGPTIAGALNSGTPANGLYAGGQGGDSGCNPNTQAGCLMDPDGLAGPLLGDIGGLGGAGGTSGRIGDRGEPRVASAACPTVNPAPPAAPLTQQPIAQPSVVPTVMMPPITVQSAGSGGGGGGDHFDLGTIPNTDDQGGGGGGGGGGLRISCVGAYNQGPAPAMGGILARGAQGGTAVAVGVAVGGAGGSGSGGEVWIQSFATLTMNAAAVIDVDGPVRFGNTNGNIGCTNQASGAGGDGLVQLEAGQGPTPTSAFLLTPAPGPSSGAVFSAPPFQFAGGVTGQASSKFLFTGYGAPDYTSVAELLNQGNSGGMLSIRYEGAHEAVNSSPQNPVHNPNTVKTMATGGGPITAANINELDGYAFIRFVVNVIYPPPPGTPANAVLPFVDSITISFNAAIGCP